MMSEEFVENVTDLVGKIEPIDVEIIEKALKISVTRNPGAIKVHTLNSRYAIAKTGNRKVTRPITNFLKFLEDSTQVDWNIVLMALATRNFDDSASQ